MGGDASSKRSWLCSGDLIQAGVRAVGSGEGPWVHGGLGQRHMGVGVWVSREVYPVLELGVASLQAMAGSSHSKVQAWRVPSSKALPAVASYK